MLEYFILLYLFFKMKIKKKTKRQMAAISSSDRPSSSGPMREARSPYLPAA